MHALVRPPQVHLVESWESPDAFPSTRGNATRAIHAYSSAPLIELYVNGKTQGTRKVSTMVQAPGSYAEWAAVPWVTGNITAVARDSAGKPVATTARHTNGKAAALTLSIDAPSALTGTGEELLLDGHDAALLRASIVDGAGRVVHLAANNVSFRVVSGPGFVQGSHNGDPHCHEPNNAPWHSAYHGLVRAVVRVASVAGRPRDERVLLASIDAHGPMSAAAQLGAPSSRDAMDTSPIVVEASTPGFAPARVSIPVSTDASVAGVMAVAQAGAGKPVNFFY